MATIHTSIDRFTNVSVAALFCAAFATVSYSATAPLPPTNATVTIMVGETEPVAAAQPASMTSAEAASIGWSDIKDYTAEKRSQFLAGLQRMEAKVSAQLSELTAKRATLKTTTSRKELDHALNELSNAQFFLKTMGELLSRATPQTWEQQKAKVGLAWTKSQEAYAKAQTRTTS